MALVKSVLKNEIRKITDQKYDGFEGFPETVEETAERWANAIDVYASSIIPAVISSTAAKEAAQSQFLSLNLNGLVAFPLGFTQYAIQLGLAMQPTYTSVPPPIPIVLAPVFSLGLSGASSEDCASLMATIADKWFKTGLATLNSPPNTVIPWS